MQTNHASHSHVPTSTVRRVVVTVTALPVALTVLQLTAPPVEASAASAVCVSRGTSTDWNTAVARAKKAWGKAQTNIAHGHYGKATRQLRIMKRKTQIANTAATALIGKPPTDPESDDPPGVTAVLRVGGLEHTVTMALVPLFDDPHGSHVVPPLAKGLIQADACRDMMLDRVIALKPGKRDDYVDGLSDTLTSYPKELTAIAGQLDAGGGLTSAGRRALQRAHTIVSDTDAAMEGVFGGGERSPGRH